RKRRSTSVRPLVPKAERRVSTPLALCTIIASASLKDATGGSGFACPWAWARLVGAQPLRPAAAPAALAASQLRRTMFTCLSSVLMSLRLCLLQRGPARPKGHVGAGGRAG